MQDRSDVNLEFAHLYAEDLTAGIQPWIERDVAAARMYADAATNQVRRITTTVFIDDYGVELDRQRVVQQLQPMFAERGLTVDWFAFEGDCARAVPDLINALPPRALERAERHVRFLRKGQKASSSVVIAEPHRTLPDESIYSCGALATVWYLARLGVSPYLEALSLYPGEARHPFPAHELMTVLSTKYLHVESTVLDMVSSITPKSLRKLKERVGYYFYPDV